MNPSTLERFAKGFENPPVELRQLVKEKHSLMGKRDFSRPWHSAPPNQGRRGCRVVRRPESRQAKSIGLEMADQRQYRR